MGYRHWTSRTEQNRTDLSGQVWLEFVSSAALSIHTKHNRVVIIIIIPVRRGNKENKDNNNTIAIQHG